MTAKIKFKAWIVIYWIDDQCYHDSKLYSTKQNALNAATHIKTAEPRSVTVVMRGGAEMTKKKKSLNT